MVMLISVCFFVNCIPRAEGMADATSGRWRFIVAVTDLNKKVALRVSYSSPQLPPPSLSSPPPDHDDGDDDGSIDPKARILNEPRQ